MKITLATIWGILAILAVIKALYISWFTEEIYFVYIYLLLALILLTMKDVSNLEKESNFKSKSGDIKIIKRQ